MTAQPPESRNRTRSQTAPTATLSRPYRIVNRQRTHRIDAAGLHKLLPRLIDDLGTGVREFSIVFVRDAVMREYNHTYRGFDKPTDVLSFRSGGDELGDILISTETAYRQVQTARRSGFDFNTNVARLVLHGLLHLAGYDHETDNGEMRAIERRLRRRHGC